MGIMDVIEKETRVELKMSDLCALIRADTKATSLKKAVLADVPNEYIRKMITGENDELLAYKETGLDPDRIRKMDELYAKKCQEVAALEDESKDLNAVIDELTERLKRYEEENMKLKKELEDAYSWIKDKKESGIDVGRIRALHKVDWSIADIAVDVGCSVEDVQRVLKKKK